MYRRDLGVVLLSIFAIFWSLQHEGAYRYYKSFYYSLPKDERLLEEKHGLPAPVVVRPDQQQSKRHGPPNAQVGELNHTSSVCCIEGTRRLAHVPPLWSLTVHTAQAHSSQASCTPVHFEAFLEVHCSPLRAAG
jgi:hypothetical protein